MHCHSGRTVCTFSNSSSNWLPLRVQSNIANNWLHLLYNFSLCFKSHWLHLFDCVFSMSPQIACLSEWEVTLVVFIQLFRCLKVQLVALFLCYAFSNASTNCLLATKVSERHVPQTIWLHLFNFSPCLKSHKSHLTLTFLTVRFQMSLQIGCLWECKVTLVAFIQLSPMFENFWRGGFVEYFYHMKVLINLKIHTIHHWKQMRKIVVNKLESCNAQTINTLTLYITLASLVWLFSTARFQMFPQSASMDWYKVTHIAIVLFFSTFSPMCVLQMFPQVPAWIDSKTHWSHLFYCCPPCVFKCLLKLPTPQSLWLRLFNLSLCLKSHWLHLFSFSPLCGFKCLLKLPALQSLWLHLFNFSLCLRSHWLHLFDFFSNVHFQRFPQSVSLD